MGQKVHPEHFRLIINQKPKSVWYPLKNRYSCLLEQDFKIRNAVYNTFEDILALSGVHIFRSDFTRLLSIEIHALNPSALEVSKYFDENAEKFFSLSDKPLKEYKTEYSSQDFITYSLIKKSKILVNNIQKFEQLNISINFKFFRTIYESAVLIAKYIVNQLEIRVPYRKIIKQVLFEAEDLGVLGIKVQISGRLNGVEMARTEWLKYGIVQLQTLDSKIQYSSERAETIFGSIGVKVWLSTTEQSMYETFEY